MAVVLHVALHKNENDDRVNQMIKSSYRLSQYICRMILDQLD